FDPVSDESSVAREFLSQISVVKKDSVSDLEKLALFLEAARKLNTAGALDEIMVSLIDTTLKLTGAERGFIFTCAPDVALQLGAGITAKGERLTTDETISRSILEDGAKSASEFVVGDTSKMSELAARQSIIAHDLRTVIAMPLRKSHVKAGQEDNTVLGVL